MLVTASMTRMKNDVMMFTFIRFEDEPNEKRVKGYHANQSAWVV